VVDQSLLYRPRNAWLSRVYALMGGPSPSRPDDPAIRFGADGIDYHESYGRAPVTHLYWNEIRAVALVSGPIEGRQALCVYTFDELPEADITVGELFTGSGPGLGVHFRSLFGTPIAVHWHHVTGPPLRRLSARLPRWTAGRITLG
jgi:hypothetical protein